MEPYSPELEEEVLSESEDQTDEPPMYRVLLHNDDYTTMEFVVQILMVVFHKPFEEATHIMLNVHQQGLGVCGVYSFEVAETKVELVHELARKSGYPLKCSMEKDSS
ncbi:MAG: ATP-dependent Clp protease adapter ClpS [Desulfobacterales bacterium]|jgi:ATP-dependent Clp protease adaptor protein ClpS